MNMNTNICREIAGQLKTLNPVAITERILLAHHDIYHLFPLKALPSHFSWQAQLDAGI